MTISKLPTSASLKQVMDKFEEISLQDFSSIDIITASELPINVKEGQIVIITQNTPNKIYISFDSNEINLDHNDILLQISDKTTNKNTIYSGNKEISLTYKYCIQNGNFIESYYGKNNEWIQITFTKTYIFENGVTSIGTFKEIGGYNQSTLISEGNLNLKVNESGVYSYSYINNTSLLDLKNYNTLFIKISNLTLPDASSSWASINNYIDFGISKSKNSSDNYYVSQKYNNLTTSKSYTNLVVELDISNIDSGYFLLRGGYQGSGSKYNKISISEIYIV